MALAKKFDPTPDISFRKKETETDITTSLKIEPKKETGELAKPVQKQPIRETFETSSSVQNHEKRRVGRPKVYEENRKRINIYLTEDVIEKTDIFKFMLPGGRSEYIEKLIKRDMEENYDRYMTTYNMTKLI